MNELESLNSLIIQQKKEWGEILTGFETKNAYSIKNLQGQELFLAAEESNMLLRLILKGLRPLTFNIVQLNQNIVLKLTRPFKFFFHEMSVYDQSNSFCGVIKRQFSLLRRIYKVYDENNQELYEIFGPLLHPWTFEIKKNDQVLGKITKKWSGLGKELLTDADNFGIEFPQGIDLKHKSILMGAVFLIDLVHFEHSS